MGQKDHLAVPTYLEAQVSMPMTGLERLWIAGLAAGALAIAGCGQGTSPPSALKRSETGPPPEERVASASSRPEGPTARKVASSVDLSVLKYDQLQAAIQAQRGHVVVMDVWAEY